MTPRRLDPSIVHARLAVIRRLLDDLAEVDAAGEPPLAENRMLRYGIERILIQLVEECGVIDKQLCDDLLPSVGMRNILVPEYLEVDLQRVAMAVPRALSCYRGYVQQVAAFASRVD
ncbi:MAG TPA: HepT-like ribonuclease domain-containing protein [Pseudonocardiaceae bacterium]|nr:HepT-like ribonuclease domain-containing protein [Pseudonocardiaceae bacterium]